MSAPETTLDAAAAHLVDRDPDLPRLATLLDDVALSTWLSEALGGSVTARRTYLRYKPGTSLVTTAEVEAGDEAPPDLPERLVVQHWSADARAKVTKVRAKAAPASLVHLEQGAGLVVTSPSGDRHLPALRRLLDPAARDAALADVDLGGPVTGLTTLSYKPHRRWVGAVDGPRRRVLVRAYPPAELADRTAGARALRGDAAPTSELIATRRRLGVAVLGWVEGDPLRLPSDLGVVPALGATLGRLHAVPARLPRTTAYERAQEVGTTVSLAARLLPGLAGRLARLRETCVDALAALPDAPEVTVHGDLSADQVVVRPDGAPVLLDLDRARTGEAGDDLGSLAASCLLAGLDAPAVLDALRPGYAGPWPAPRVLATWTLAQLLLRSTEAFRAADADWPARLTTAVGLAEGVADDLRGAR